MLRLYYCHLVMKLEIIVRTTITYIGFGKFYWTVQTGKYDDK